MKYEVHYTMALYEICKWFSSPLHNLNGIQYQYSESMLLLSVHLLQKEICSNDCNMRLDNLNNGLRQYWWDDTLYQSLGFNFICGCSKHCISEKLCFCVKDMDELFEYWFYITNSITM